MSSYGVTRALAELHSIFACQWPNGMLPQIRFAPLPDGSRPYRPDAADWDVPAELVGNSPMLTSGITQPPVVGMCVRDIYSLLDPDDREKHHASFLAMAVSLGRFHDWLLRERDPLGESLAACIHPWETGMDNTPAFEAPIEATRGYVEQNAHRLDLARFARADKDYVAAEQRPTGRDYRAYFGLVAFYRLNKYIGAAVVEASPFLVQDVLFNTVLSVSLEATADLLRDLAGCANTGSEQNQHLLQLAERSRSRAGAVAAAIREKLWDAEDGCFYGRDLRADTLLRVPTVAQFMPLLGCVASDAQASVLEARLTGDEFASRFPVPSTGQSSPHFDAVRYWSGPSWPVTNWLIWRGLRERRSPLTGKIQSATLDMIAQGQGYDSVAQEAAALMEANSEGKDDMMYTTPSRRQYRHAWLWDSAITATCWPHVSEKPQITAQAPEMPGFWEYFHPYTGQPLGAPRMTWTAALFLDLLRSGSAGHAKGLSSP